MKSNKLKRSLSFLMSVLLVLGTFGSDFATVTATAAETPETEKTYTVKDTSLSSSTVVSGAKVTKSAVVNGDQITFTFKVDGDEVQHETTTKDIKTTDVVFVMDLSNSMVEEETYCPGHIGRRTVCNHWFSWQHTDSCYENYTYNCNGCEERTVDRLTPAKNAAIAFTNNLLADDLKAYVNVGVASFGTNGYSNKTLSKNKSDVIAAINALTVAPGQDSGGTNIQAGLREAEAILNSSKADNKFIVVLSDGVPTYSYKKKTEAKNQTTLNNGEKVKLYTEFKKDRTDDGSAMSNEEYIATISESYLAQAKGIKVFAIAYDLTNANSKTMINVASANTAEATYFYNASSTTNDVSSSIANVMGAVAKEIKTQTNVASAQDIVIKDTLPGYITFNNQTVSGVTFDGNQKFTMNIGTLAKNQSVTKTITATIDMDQMITYYASELGWTEDEVRAQMASEDGLAVSLNGNVVISFKDSEGNEQPDNTDIKIDSSVEGAEVPTDIFHAYPYSLTVNIDGKKSDLSQSGNAYAGEVISVNLDSYKNVNEYTITTDLAKDYEFTVSATGKNDYVVNINHKKYNVTFKNGENIISSVDYFWNDTVVIPEDPTKDSDAQYSYDFKGWDPTVATTVNGSAVYNAEYELKVNSYKVYFKNYDGTILNGEGKGEVYTYGSTPEYKGATPTKPETDAKTFTFAGWDKEITAVTGDVIYTAVFTDVDKLFTVTFVNYDGTVLETLTGLKWGDAVAYSGNTPLKPADNENTYTFADTWDPALVSECNGDATYEAQFSSEKITYTVKFVADGKVVSEQNLSWGDAVNVPADPTKAADNYNTYEFKNWTPSVSETCKGDVTYTAVFDQTAIEYTITFLNEDDSVYDSYKVGYGEALTTPVAPTKESTDTTKYTFAGWTPVVPATCEGNATFKATFDESARYTVIFMNGKEEVAKFVVDDGEKIEAPDFANLTKEADETYTYTCTGWDKEVETEVHASATYNAKFAETYIEYTVRFLNEDDSVISSTEYHYGDTVEEATATKANTQEYTYTFAGWTPEFVAKCEGSVDYKAQFNAKRNKYTVNFLDYDGTVIETITKDYGTPFNAPADPDRDADKTYTYKFAGWDKTVADTVTENVTYTATYDRTYIDYTVKFVDENGKEVATFVKHYNETIEVPEVPAKAADDQYTYVPNGWTPSVNTSVTEDATYEPVYRNVLNKYTITFYNDQKVYAQKEYEYGSKVEIPEDPTKDADATYTYTFAGWTPEVVDVVNNAEYYAVFTPVFIDYKVNFYGANDKLIVTKTAHYNGTVAAPTATAPTGMHFTGWDKTFNPVTEDIDVYAQFDYNTYRANFYVVKPDRLASIKAEPVGPNAGIVAQSSSDYIDTKASAEFKYTFADNKTVGEYFGAHKALENGKTETTVEDIFGNALPTVGTLTYTTAKGNTLKLSDFDWYVIKNAENSTGSKGWHVDGYAKNVELVAPVIKDLDYTIKYTGAVRNDYVAARVAEDIAALSNADKTYTVKRMVFGRDIQNVDTTYTAKAYVEYTSEGLTVETEVDVKVTVEAVDAVVTIKGISQETTYNADNQTAEVKYSVTIDADENYNYSEADFEFVGEESVSGKDAGIYYYGLSEKSFENKNANVNVTFKVTDAALTILPKEAVYTIETLSKVYGDEDPELSVLLDGVFEGDVIDYSIFREEGENVGLYDVFVVFGANEIRPFAVNQTEEESEENEVVYANDNYYFTSEEEVGKFEITKRPVRVVANDASKVAGEADPTLSANIENLVAGDGNLGQSVYVWRVAGESAGNYDMFAGINGIENWSNYSVTFVDGVFTITAAAVIPTPPVAPPTNPVPPTTPTVVPTTPTVVPPTPVVEEVPEVEPEVVPEVEIPEEETPMAEAPEEVPEVTPVVVPEVEIAEEDTPLAAGHCFIHWIILLDTLIYAAYVALRATQNARELKDEKNAVEE